MVAFATQVKRRRGTEAQNNEFTGAEGEITVDLTNMTLRVHDGMTRGGFVVGGGAGRNIGDVFFTARTDTTLNGAVEANGGQYNTTDFDGADAIGNILSAGKVPYMTIADFDTAVANNGECTSFGWDGGTVFKVPKINGRRLIRRQLPTADNNYMWYNLYSDGWIEQGGYGISGSSGSVILAVEMADASYHIVFGGDGRSSNNNTAVVVGYNKTTTGFTIQSNVLNNAGSSSATGSSGCSWQVNGYAAESQYNDKSTWQYDRYMRPMVQLANGATDEAVVVAGNVLSDIADLKMLTEGMIDYVVEKQDPTAENNYTWYRKYKSGWVEQGGITDVATGNNNITLPIPMLDVNYTALVTRNSGASSTGQIDVWRKTPNDTTTTFCVYAVNATGVIWTVSGMSEQ